MKNDRDSNPKMAAFLDEVKSVCEKHGLAIGHEDGQGAFYVYDYDDPNFFSWMDAAFDETTETLANKE